MRRIKAKSWSETLSSKPAAASTTVTESDVLAAYQQGRRDFEAGRSINAPRYSDRTKDEAWHRGQCDAMRERQKRQPARCR